MSTMRETEAQNLEKLREHAIKTRAFLTNKMKPERERSVCRAFLRAIGVPLEEQELVAPTDEPADVAFRTARFQVRELLEPHRRIGDDWRAKEKKYSEAKSLAHVLEPYTLPASITLNGLVPEVVGALSEKARKYGLGCSDVDALVYVNRETQFLAANSLMPDLAELRSQGWRSVSVVFPPYGVILCRKSMCPDFLSALRPGQQRNWRDIDSLFEGVAFP